MTVNHKLADLYWNDEITKEKRIEMPLPYMSKDLNKITDNVYFQYSLGNIGIILTKTGIVLIDSGMYEAGEILYERLTKHFPNKWVIACIYTHGHIDHVEGLNAIQKMQTERKGPKITVYAHKNVNGRFDRYCMTCGYNHHINNKQFGGSQDLKNSFDNNFIRPDIIYGDQNIFKTCIDGVNFELHHFKGETDDATTIYIPEYKTLCPGDLFIWNVPNCGNPQKVQRYAYEWMNAMYEMIKFNAEIMLPGHGPYILTNQRINTALKDTGDFLKDLFDQTLILINKNVPLNKILHLVEPRYDLMKKPYLGMYYDHWQFIVRNIWRRYAGWYDFYLPNLLPECDEKISIETMKLFNNDDQFINMIEKYLSENELKLSLHFLEFAKNSNNQKIHTLRYFTLEKIINENTSLMARNIYKYDQDLMIDKICEKYYEHLKEKYKYSSNRISSYKKLNQLDRTNIKSKF